MQATPDILIATPDRVCAPVHTPEPPEHPNCLKAGYAALHDIDFSVEAGKEKMRVARRSIAGYDGAFITRRIGLATLQDGREMLLLRQRPKAARDGSQDRYILHDGEQALECVSDAVESFLQQRRRGYHGGLGRAQGRKSADGCSYPKATCMLLSQDEVVALVDIGGGDLSLGVRRLSEREVRTDEEAAEASPGTKADGDRESRAQRLRVKVYLDAASRARLTAGGASLVEGVRRRLLL